MNLVMQIGRIAADPDIRTANNSNMIANFRIAVNRQFKDQNGERQADFHNCVAFKGQAEFISRYLKKGDLIAVKGTLQNRSYDAQDGSKRWVSEIICDSVESLSSRSEASATPSARNDVQTGFEVAEDDEALPY